VSNLRIDYHSGVQQIVEYLSKQGHRRIAFVAREATIAVKRCALAVLRKVYEGFRARA